MLFPWARSALALSARSLQHTTRRQKSHHSHQDFHDKYGNMVLLGGAGFFAAVWILVLTQGGIEWNCSPVGRITPKEWRDK